MRYVRDQQARAGEVRLPRAPGARCLQSLAAVSGQAVNDTASPEVCRDAAWSAHPVRRLHRVINEQKAVARVAAVRYARDEDCRAGCGHPEPAVLAHRHWLGLADGFTALSPQHRDQHKCCMHCLVAHIFGTVGGHLVQAAPRRSALSQLTSRSKLSFGKAGGGHATAPARRRCGQMRLTALAMLSGGSGFQTTALRTPAST